VSRDGYDGVQVCHIFAEYLLYICVSLRSMNICLIDLGIRIFDIFLVAIIGIYNARNKKKFCCCINNALAVLYLNTDKRFEKKSILN